MLRLGRTAAVAGDQDLAAGQQAFDDHPCAIFDRLAETLILDRCLDRVVRAIQKIADRKGQRFRLLMNGAANNPLPWGKPIKADRALTAHKYRSPSGAARSAAGDAASTTIAAGPPANSSRRRAPRPRALPAAGCRSGRSPASCLAGRA